MALSNYDRNNLSSAQQRGIDEATRAWNEASARGDAAGMEAAHARAESIRNSAGYTSDSWGRYSGSLPAAEKPAARQDAQPQTGAREQQDRLAEQYRQQIEEQRRELAEQQRRAEEEQRRATEAAVNRAVGELEGRKSDAEKEYAELFRQLYLDKMRNRKNLDQRLAAQGFTGGAAESTALGYDSAYEDALRLGERDRLAARSEFDRAIADARAAGDVESARTAAERARAEAERSAASIRDLLARRDTLDARREANAREDAARAERYEREDAQREERYAREDAAAARTAALALAQRYLDAGRMPPAELLARAGMNEATARELLAIRAEESENAERKAAQKPLLTAAQVIEALKNGIRTDAVLAAYEYYYGAPWRG